MDVSTIVVAGKKVIYVDCSNSGRGSGGDVAETLKKGSAMVAVNPEKSVYIITDVTKLQFNSQMAAAFREYALANTRYVKASVIVGLSGLQLVAFSTIKAVTKREYQLCQTLDEAKAYLAGI
jgi:hypothetical protein